MAVTKEQVSADTGEIYDAVDGGTTAVDSMIERANSLVVTIAGTTTGYDGIARPLADSFVVNQVMGGIDSVNKTIGNLSVGNKDLRSMRKFFYDEARRAAILNGFSLDGLKILFKDSSQ